MGPSLVKWLITLDFILLLNSAAKSDPAEGDESRPYEFGFIISGEQHRYEKKDERGIIMGEYGFITGDGVYHVTVYATDENGDFKILKTRNFWIGLNNQTSPRTTMSTKSDVKQLSGMRGCGGCFVPAGLKPPEFVTGRQEPNAVEKNYGNKGKKPNPIERRIDTTPGFINRDIINTGLHKAQHSSKPNTVGGSFNNKEFRDQQSKNGPNPNDIKTSIPFNPSSNKYNLNKDSFITHRPIASKAEVGHFENHETSHKSTRPINGMEINNKIKFYNNNFNAQDKISKNGESKTKHIEISQGNHDPSRILSSTPFGKNAHAMAENLSPYNFNTYSSVNDKGTISKNIQSNVQNVVSSKNKKTGSIVFSPFSETNKTYSYDEKTLSTVIIFVNRYRFNYSLTFHGHEEKGDTSGNKRGSYFWNGRDGLQRRVVYTADESGFRPKVSVAKLGLKDTPNEMDEKERSQLNGSEFLWYFETSNDVK